MFVFMGGGVVSEEWMSDWIEFTGLKGDIPATPKLLEVDLGVHPRTGETGYRHGAIHDFCWSWHGNKEPKYGHIHRFSILEDEL